MMKNRTVQLIFQTVYCTLGLVGSFACLGIFDDINMIRWDFYAHFTNISNFLCLGIMFAALIQTVKKKEDSYVTISPALKFTGAVGILLTFLVFNILLAGEAGRPPQLNWRIGSICFHVILPVMFIADWVLFYERGKIKWFYPLTALLFPLSYIFFIYVQAAILKFDTSILMPVTAKPLIYPYFFLNLEKQGVCGTAMWIFGLLIFLITIGYLLFGIDKLGKKKTLG
jgi:hypothetical protein